MVTRIQINSDFGSGQSVSKGTAVAAAKKVVKDADGIEDAKLLLDMLGLIPPQPGNEIKIPKKPPRKKKPQVKAPKHVGVDPSEYGE